MRDGMDEHVLTVSVWVPEGWTVSDAIGELVELVHLTEDTDLRLGAVKEDLR